MKSNNKKGRSGDGCMVSRGGSRLFVALGVVLHSRVFFFSFILCISFPFFIVVIPGVPHFLCLCPPPPLLLLAVCITLCVVPVCFVAFYLFFLFSVYHLPFFCCVCVLSHTSAHLRTFYLSTIFFFVFTSSFLLRFVFFFIIIHIAYFSAKRSFSYAEVRTQDRSREKKSTHSHYQSL